MWYYFNLPQEIYSAHEIGGRRMKSTRAKGHFTREQDEFGRLVLLLVALKKAFSKGYLSSDIKDGFLQFQLGREDIHPGSYQQVERLPLVQWYEARQEEKKDSEGKVRTQHEQSPAPALDALAHPYPACCT